ncbi:hypothetical protein D9M72_584280 [compost metagenome]
MSEANERSGIDVTEHAETAYELLMVGGTFHPGEHHGKPGPADAPAAEIPADATEQNQAERGRVRT